MFRGRKPSDFPDADAAEENTPRVSRDVLNGELVSDILSFSAVINAWFFLGRMTILQSSAFHLSFAYVKACAKQKRLALA